jgi:Mg2+-importing ATPase
VPFLRSRPSVPLTVATLAVVATGVVLPFSPLAGALGFRPVPMAFLAVLIGLAVAYLLLVEATKRHFFATLSEHEPRRHRAATHRLHRRAGRFSHAGPLRRS